MSRLGATVRSDVRLQMRNGFYWAAGFLAFFSILVLNLLNAETLAWIVPPFVFSNLLMNTFYFIGGLVLLQLNYLWMSGRIRFGRRSSPARSGATT